LTSGFEDGANNPHLLHDIGGTTMSTAPHEELHDHDRGLAYDLSTLMARRRALKMLAGAGVVALAGCASATKVVTASSSSSTTPTTAAGSTPSAASSSAASSTAASSTAAIPEETAGPYPGDGSNGVNVLTQSGIVRRDITSSFGSARAKAVGVPTTVILTVVKAGTGAPLAGAAVYLWHCDRDGNYSLYSQGVTGENYLRGVQQTDTNGTVTFTTIFPGCYSGRWPHIHYEVYPTLASATAASGKIATSQLALPKATCDAVYATDGYSSSVSNLSQVTLATDNVFSDGAERETPTVSGTTTAGIVMAMSVPVSA
jgi:protocatechuate 3,4-dioxygenase beta subunit